MLPCSLFGRHRSARSVKKNIVAIVCWGWLTAICSLVTLSFLSCVAWAKDEPNAGGSSSTAVAILGGGDELASPRYQRIFKAAGFNVALIDGCKEDARQDCLRKSLQDAKRRFKSQNIMLVTSALHSRAVYSIYQSAEMSALLSGVILFRADPDLLTHPIKKTRPRPRLFLIAGEADGADIIRASRRFADHIRQSGTWSWFVMMPRQTRSEKRDSLLTKMVRFFAGRLPRNDPLFETLDGHTRWQHPPLNHDGFFDHANLVKPYPVDGAFRNDMATFFAAGRGQLKQWELKTFNGIDLLAYRDRRMASEGMRYAVLTNHKGELCVLDLDLYASYGPVIVVGVDHERNLFRLNGLYRLKRRYSWIRSRTPIRTSVNPLGAFLHFRKPLPAKLKLPLHARSALGYNSIRFTNRNPLADLERLPPKVRKTVTGNCILCHSLDGSGGSAHHLAASTATPQGGFALPLRSYSKDVLYRFLFHQNDVAASFGVLPNPVPVGTAKALYEFLTRGK